MYAFEYKPLQSPDNDIRLLQLHPSGDEEEPVSCNIINVPLAESPSYTALSYTWGNTSQMKNILVNESLAPVTVNLESALRGLRHDSNPIVLWADALCINQRDDLEKSRQVQNMKKIFQTAVRVVGWLGEHAPRSDPDLSNITQIGKAFVDLNGMEAVRKVGLCIREAKPAKLALAREELDHICARLRDVYSEATSYPVEALLDLSNREYWTRVWILQEVCVAKELEFICGRELISYSHLLGAIHFYNTQRAELLMKAIRSRLAVKPATLNLDDFLKTVNEDRPFSNMPSSFGGARWRFQRNPEEGDETLMQLATRASIRTDPNPCMQVTDPRDRIFGLFAMAKDIQNLKISPDYSKSCDEVYIDAARSWLRSGEISILTCCQYPRFNSSLPTWVPDWRGVIRRPCGGYTQDFTFSAAGKTQQHAGIENVDPTIVQLRGTVIDKVECIGSAWNPEKKTYASGNYIFDYEDAGVMFAEVEDFVKQSSAKNGSVYQTSSQLEEVVWRVPIADQEMSPTTLNWRATSLSHQGYEEVKRGIQLGIEEQGKYTDPKNSYINMMGYCHNRRPLLSQKGYVGLSPGRSEVGDIIVILLGAHVPFLMRAHEDGKTIQLVGEAYIHGIMDGEYLETDPKFEDFNVR